MIPPLKTFIFLIIFYSAKVKTNLENNILTYRLGSRI